MEAKTIQKIRKLRTILENIKDFELVKFEKPNILADTIYIKLTKKQPSGYLLISEKHIKISEIDNEIKIAKKL